MKNFLFGNRKFLLVIGSYLMTFTAFCLMSQTVNAQLTGQELLRVTRVAQGGSQYAELQYITARSQGYVNVSLFGATALGTGGGIAPLEIKMNLVDYQSRQRRRRLTITPTVAMVGETYLIYDGNAGGGMLQGNPFRVSEAAMSRQWAMMGFDTLNQAADGKLFVVRKDDVVENGMRYYVVEVKFSPSDTVQYLIDERNFLIYKVRTRFNDKPLVEEIRSDYRMVSCMMLPFRIITKLQGQQLADLNISEYDLRTTIPTTYFVITEGR